MEYDPRLRWAVSTERLLHRVARTSEHSPREIAARGVHKVVTENIISQGESPRLRTGCSVVRGKPSNTQDTSSIRFKNLFHSQPHLGLGCDRVMPVGIVKVRLARTRDLLSGKE